ncbi:MAG: hypothetical protein K0U64_01965 [Actinomycetia bacterium]|nr:hypothetical protein [Actinomycetes bacterium]
MTPETATPTPPQLTPGPSAVSYHSRIAGWFITFGACLAAAALVIEIPGIPLPWEIGGLLAVVSLFALTRGIKALGLYHRANEREVAGGYTTVAARKTIRANKQRVNTADLWVLAPDSGAVVRKPAVSTSQSPGHPPSQ